MFGLRSQKKPEKPNSGAEDGSQGQRVYLARGLCLTLSSVKKKKEKLNTKERVESWEANMRGHLTNSATQIRGRKIKLETHGHKRDRETMQRVKRGKVWPGLEA